jgi:hypothetical protein
MEKCLQCRRGVLKTEDHLTSYGRVQKNRGTEVKVIRTGSGRQGPEGRLTRLHCDRDGPEDQGTNKTRRPYMSRSRTWVLKTREPKRQEDHIRVGPGQGS